MAEGETVPPRRTRRRLGNFGEAAAAAYLARQGYELLERQWHTSTGEIDLIARHNGQLVFVEVRTRSNRRYGSPEESVTAAKQARLIALAYAYLEAHSLDDTTPWRIDVVAVEVDQHSGRISRLEHVVNAVEG
jgi:putative endonuclease